MDLIHGTSLRKTDENMREEYTALKKEIDTRSQSQHNIVTVNLTVSGILTGIALGQNRELAALVVLPMFSPMLGLLYLGHAESISKIGRYVHMILPHGYERVVRDEERKGDEYFWLMVGFLVPILVTFMGGPVIALSIMFWIFLQGEDVRLVPLWCVGFTLTCAFVFLWARWARGLHRKPKFKV